MRGGAGAPLFRAGEVFRPGTMSARIRLESLK
jgi:hypothetical protein